MTNVTHAKYLSVIQLVQLPSWSPGRLVARLTGLVSDFPFCSLSSVIYWPGTVCVVYCPGSGRTNSPVVLGLRCGLCWPHDMRVSSICYAVWLCVQIQFVRPDDPHLPQMFVYLEGYPLRYPSFIFICALLKYLTHKKFILFLNFIFVSYSENWAAVCNICRHVYISYIFLFIFLLVRLSNCFLFTIIVHFLAFLPFVLS